MSDQPRYGPAVRAAKPEKAPFDVERSPKNPPVFSVVTRSPRRPAVASRVVRSAVLALDEARHVEPMGVVHRDVHGFRRLGTGAVELDQDVQGVQVEPAVHVSAHLELAAARLLLRGAAHVEIVRGHVGALDATRDGRRRDAVLIGDDGVRAQEPAELGAGERAGDREDRKSS